MAPFIVARKGPRAFDSRMNSDDGMLAPGATILFLHDLKHVENRVSVVTGGARLNAKFEIPARVDEDDMRALPISSIVGVGRSVHGYLQYHRKEDVWTLPVKHITEARSTSVLKAMRPHEVFQDEDYDCALSAEETRRVPKFVNTYHVGDAIHRKYNIYGRLRTELVGSPNEVVGAIAAVTFLTLCRRWDYTVEWKPGTRRLRNALKIGHHFDEGEIDDCFIVAAGDRGVKRRKISSPT